MFGWALVTFLVLVAAGSAQAEPFGEVRSFVADYCANCHQEKVATAGLDLTRFNTIESVHAEPETWTKVLTRVRDHAMPPRGTPAPSDNERQKFTAWVENTLLEAACGDGTTPSPFPVRRLNRHEYSATIRDLFNIHFNAGHALPEDGAGGEGFDNAAETLFLSPIHAEKYLEAATEAISYAAKGPKSRATFLIAEPSDTTPPEEAARTILEAFLPRAFRRPATEKEVERYLSLYRRARKRGESFEPAVLYALRGALISPHFLFRLETRLNNSYATASRLSYFLWASMPDDELFCMAEAGALDDDIELDRQVVRMLEDIKTREFARQFAEQWLGTRELGRDIQPDKTLFPELDAELESAMRYEPILFLQEVLAKNHSLLALLDSDFTMLNRELQKHYGLNVKKLRQQHVRVDLPENSHRGGVLGMSAVLAVSSLPHRTSPVLRGKWILESLLGTPPPPPPPDVPELEEPSEGAPPATVRERLEQHRENPVCASCHDRIDPLGFGLENYDVLGRWRTHDAGLPIDSRGTLPDGATYDGPEELKAILLDRKTQFIRNLTAKMLGYALGRGLTLEDQCTVEAIVKKLEQNDHRAHILIQEIVRSVPFRNWENSK